MENMMNAIPENPTSGKQGGFSPKIRKLSERNSTQAERVLTQRFEKNR